LKKLSYITLLSCIIIILLLFPYTYKDTKNNLIIANKSSEIITDIVIQRVNKSNTIGNNLKSNQHCYFNMGVQKNCAYKVEFEDKNNKSTLSKEFTSDFQKDKLVNINILKDNNGEWSIIVRN